MPELRGGEGPAIDLRVRGDRRRRAAHAAGSEWSGGRWVLRRIVRLRVGL
jgi:hypothetical protein